VPGTNCTEVRRRGFLYSLRPHYLVTLLVKSRTPKTLLSTLHGDINSKTPRPQYNLSRTGSLVEFFDPVPRIVFSTLQCSPCTLLVLDQASTGEGPVLEYRAPYDVFLGQKAPDVRVQTGVPVVS